MFIKLAPRARQAWTLVETMVAVGIFSLSGIGIMGLYLFSVKTMAAMYSYCLLDASNRHAMDLLTREIRQATMVLNYTTNSITIQSANPSGATAQVSYTFNPSAKQLLRTSGGDSTILLNNCSLLSFQLFTRCPSNGVFGSFPVAINNWSNTVKVVQLTWKTSIVLPIGRVSSENVQTARIVIRKQQNS
ncbi:MAG: hypothetical protein NT154_14555 [Verrucomicrobia bacterium]|nr:hypothetical protein [Verrucomicrobiota bacterium]